VDKKWTQIILDAEDMWAKSAIYRYFPLSASKEEFETERDLFKIRRIYDLYGYGYALRFAKEHPSTMAYLDKCVPCMQYANQGQCTMFCHKYDFEKGCTLNATE
jgi:hypothetical protein